MYVIAEHGIQISLAGISFSAPSWATNVSCPALTSVLSRSGTCGFFSSTCRSMFASGEIAHTPSRYTVLLSCLSTESCTITCSVTADRAQPTCPKSLFIAIDRLRSPLFPPWLLVASQAELLQCECPLLLLECFNVPLTKVILIRSLGLCGVYMIRIRLIIDESLLLLECSIYLRSPDQVTLRRLHDPPAAIESRHRLSSAASSYKLRATSSCSVRNTQHTKLDWTSLSDAHETFRSTVVLLHKIVIRGLSSGDKSWSLFFKTFEKKKLYNVKITTLRLTIYKHNNLHNI